MGRVIILRKRLSSAPDEADATVTRSRNSVSESMASALASGVYTSVGPSINERQSSKPEETSVVKKSSTSRSNASLDNLKPCDCSYGAAMTCSCNVRSDSPLLYDSCEMLALASQHSSPVQGKSPSQARKLWRNSSLTNVLSTSTGVASTTASTGWVGSSFGTTAVLGNSAANWWQTDNCGAPETSSSTESLMNTPTTASIGNESLTFYSDSDSEAYFSTVPNVTASFATALDNRSGVWPSPTGQPEFKKNNESLLDKTITDLHTISTLAKSEEQNEFKVDCKRTSAIVSCQSGSSDTNKIKKFCKVVGESVGNVSVVGDDDTERSYDGGQTDVENLASKFDAMYVNSKESGSKEDSQCIYPIETKSKLFLHSDESKNAGTSLQRTNVEPNTQEGLATGYLNFPISSDIKKVTELGIFSMTDNSVIFGGGVGIDRGNSDKFCGIGARYRKVKEWPTIVVQYSIKELRASFSEISSFIYELTAEYPGPGPLQRELLIVLTRIVSEFTCSRLKLDHLTKLHDFVSPTWQRQEPLDDPKASLIVMKDLKRKWRETLKKNKPIPLTRETGDLTEQTFESGSASNYETSSNADLLKDEHEFSLMINHLIAVVFFWNKRLNKRLELIQSQIRDGYLELDELKIFLADKDFTLDSMEKEAIISLTDAELLTIGNSVNSDKKQDGELNITDLRSFIDTLRKTSVNLNRLKK